MFWFIMGVVLLLLGYVIWHYSFVSCRNDSYNDHIGFFVYAIVAVLAWTIPAIVVSANEYNMSRNVHNSAVLVTNKETQRDHLLVLVKDALSDDAYRELTAATPASDVLVILGNQASSILIERAKQIVQLNSDLYSLQNRITGQEIDLCNMVENPLLPSIPFIGPDCHLQDAPVSHG